MTVDLIFYSKEMKTQMLAIPWFLQFMIEIFTFIPKTIFLIFDLSCWDIHVTITSDLWTLKAKTETKCLKLNQNIAITSFSNYFNSKFLNQLERILF